MRERKNGLLQQAVDNLTDAPDARQDGQETVKNIDVWFQDFWRVYPLKIGKKRALAAWRKLKPRNRGEVELILGDIRARMQQD